MLRRAHIYLANADRAAIVSAMYYNAAGIYYEQEDSLLVSQWRERPGLAAALLSSLGRFSVRDRNLRELKKTDWPSFLASHCRSVREFESTYLCIAVRALNDAELVYDANVQPLGEADISLHLTINPRGPVEDIERRLVRLFDEASVWAVNLRTIRA